MDTGQQPQKEQYVLTSKDEVLAMFPTLQECLKWVPTCPLLEDSFIAWRFYIDSSGEIQRQKIQISTRIYQRNIEEFLKNIDKQCWLN